LFHPAKIKEITNVDPQEISGGYGLQDLFCCLPNKKKVATVRIRITNEARTSFMTVIILVNFKTTSRK